MDPNPYESPKERNKPPATAREPSRFVLTCALVVITLFTGVPLLTVVTMIGVALATEPEEWGPPAGANIGLGLLQLALLFNLPTAIGWIAWYLTMPRKTDKR